MSVASTQPGFVPPRSVEAPFHDERLRVPESLQRQLLEYRRRVWTIKILEAMAIVLVATLLAFVTVFALDRMTETPRILRLGLLLGVVVICALIPLVLYRWVWQRRGLEQLARLLSRKLPSIGDSLLGVIELAHNQGEQSRSPALCQAAMRQVAADAERRNFLEAVPHSRYRQWSVAAAVMLVTAMLLGVLFPAASANAWARLAAPWSEIPRYTFTRVETLPAVWHIAHGEPTELSLALTAQTRSEPETGEMRIGSQQPLNSPLVDGAYQFVIPPQIDPQPMSIAIGDTRQHVLVEPTLRPELSSVLGKVILPAYLEREQGLEKDVRGGTISVVAGSQIRISAVANRPLSSASVNGQTHQPTGSSFITPVVDATSTPSLRFEWRDEYGLAGRQPFDLSITAVDDEAPTLTCEGLPRQAVVLDSELLKFQIRSSDDYGIRQVGLKWRSMPGESLSTPVEGERVLAAGGSEQATMEVLGTFSATSYGIEPQPLELFIWAEDYLPGRPRVFSPPYTLYVLTPDQHAIWITEQLSKWHRQALEVRDREMQLLEVNKELRDLPEDQLGNAENRKSIERQAAAERANGRRLSDLSRVGDELIRTASRNPEIGVGHLERWAEMLGVLKDISGNRMPSVAELLQEAAEQPKSPADAQLAEASKASKSGPQAGKIRAAAGAGAPKPTDPKAPQPPSAPKIADVESSQNSPDDDAEDETEPGPPKKPSGSSLRLPGTTIIGKRQPKKEAPPRVDRSIDQAVVEQEDLLAEFEKIADELNTILANLEGSTLVKRLKAASRTQSLVASRLAEQLDHSFGKRPERIDEQVVDSLNELAGTEETSVRDVSFIMDDMAAYFERRRFAQFKLVLDEMKEMDVMGGLRQLGDEIPVKQGLSVAQSEYWSDTLDRWAENLVDPACQGQCPGGKTPASLPPSIVLEVLQILEAEVNLREETRVAEQARPAAPQEQHGEEADRLANTQRDLQNRVVAVGERIGELPKSEEHFSKELLLLEAVDSVMGDAAQILRTPDTGTQAIAAETEAIELLLRSKRINPNSGGGGGASPGGGGGGTTTDSALALLGTGTNQKEVREDRGISQTTGTSGTELPEEFRAGLDEYFNRLERVNP